MQHPQVGNLGLITVPPIAVQITQLFVDAAVASRLGTWVKQRPERLQQSGEQAAHVTGCAGKDSQADKDKGFP